MTFVAPACPAPPGGRVRRRRGPGIVLAALAGVLVLSSLSACEKGSAAAAGANGGGGFAVHPAAVMTVVPADNATHVALDSSIKVSVTNGTLGAISVHDADGVEVDGALDARAQTWS